MVFLALLGPGPAAVFILQAKLTLSCWYAEHSGAKRLTFLFSAGNVCGSKLDTGELWFPDPAHRASEMEGEAPVLLLPSPVLEPRSYTLPVQGHYPAPTICLHFMDHLLLWGLQSGLWDIVIPGHSRGILFHPCSPVGRLLSPGLQVLWLGD